MTQSAKSNIKTFIPYLAFLPTFYVLFAFGQFTESAKSRMFKDSKEKENVLYHVKDKDLHMPYSQKVKEFVPRGEFKDMKDDVKEIKSDVKELLKAK